MHSVATVLVCLACVGHGRRVQSTAKPDSVNSLTELLRATQPATGWQTTGAGAKGANAKSTLSRSPKSPVASMRDAVLTDGVYEETNMEFWDPLNLAGQVGDEALMWFRASEIKHGRVAMLASLGYALGGYDVTFPGNIAPGVSFKSINVDGPFSAWSKVPEEGKLQILISILIIEIYSEAQKPHYMRGGPVGVIPPYAGLGGAATERQKKAEMKHGRIAMFGIISFLIGHSIPGSVPLLTGSTF
mmetsp:Transcript_41676/g.72234  ORF Transcript_41676/g.72234 Transcript_41676/m.72234 type:complete len:245 (-) Transcript_41676:85-819(-)